MDLLAAERLNGKLNKAKAWALVCFAIAGGILIASLFAAPPVEQSPDGPATRLTGSLH